MLLSSKEFHNGSNPWQMIKKTDDFGGEQISKTGFAAADAYEAIVPGTVLNTLVHNDVYPEPYYGLNNAYHKNIIPDLKDVGNDFYTYWFRVEFELDSSYKGKQIILCINGINYRSELWLNGAKLGDMTGMFKRGYFNITEHALINAKNTLAVLVVPVDEPGGFKKKSNKETPYMENKNGGDGSFGKNVSMLMSAGWDFTFNDGVRDRNTGIWKNVELFAVENIELRDPFIKSELSMPDMASSRQTISVEAINHTDKPQNGTLKTVIDGMDVEVSKEISLEAGETKVVTMTPEEYPELLCKSPKLWWPINKGEQNLYEAKITFEQMNNVCDTEKARFAVRSITSDRNTPDKSRQFYVNGKPIFLHGTNWIPEAMLRKTNERMYAEMRYTAQAGINFIRFWAGGIAEDDYFFDLCDEIGIMVSMEFWLTGDTALPADTDLYRDNVIDTVKTIRNHPSLAYYISANERGTDNIVQIRDIITSYDGTRGYQEASEIAGIHDGSPYKYVNPMYYYDDTASGRGSRVWGLCPEYGTSCLPTIECLREMMDESDIYPPNKEVWDYHDGGAFHDIIARYVPAMEQYGEFTGIEDFAWKGQMVGAVGYRSVWETWTYNRGNNGDRYTSGVWFWYHNSPTRQVCGRMWDWSLEPTAALYYSQDSHEPLHAQYDFLKDTVSVNNEYYEPFQGSVGIRVFNMDMSYAYSEKVDVQIASDSVANDVIKVSLPENLSPVHFIRLDLFDKAGNKVADTFYWRSNDKYDGPKTWTGPNYSGFEQMSNLERTFVKAELKNLPRGKSVYLKNDTDALAFMVRVSLVNATDKKLVRPAFYTDNFFSILPGESKTVFIEANMPPDGTEIVVEGYNVEKVVLR
ncbi:MAG: sugar-binding domain-containing protein [Phycisphaerae bacterium]